ncbi:MAG: hypothetical protein WCD04_02810, partial [Terriglobia bacterium]
MRDCSTRYPVRWGAAGHTLSHSAALGATEGQVFIVDCGLPIVEAENRNSKIETPLHWVAAASLASFEFLVSSFEYRQSS